QRPTAPELSEADGRALGFDAADELFDAAVAAGVAGLPLDAEAVLAAGVALPADAGGQRHRHLGAGRRDHQNDVALGRQGLASLDEGAAAADVAEDADLVLQHALDLPGDGQLDGEAL